MRVLTGVPGPHRGWATYRLARLFREEGTLAALLYGQGPGIFRRFTEQYREENAAGRRLPDWRMPGNYSIPEGAAVEGESLEAWQTLVPLLPTNLAKDQVLFLSELENAAQNASLERAELYRKWARDLEA